MKLLCDDYKEIYVWVDDRNEDHELSPHFDYEEDAIRWRDRMKQELLREKNGTNSRGM